MAKTTSGSRVGAVLKRKPIYEVCLRCTDEIKYYVTLPDNDMAKRHKPARRFRYCNECLAELWHQQRQGRGIYFGVMGKPTGGLH